MRKKLASVIGVLASLMMLCSCGRTDGRASAAQSSQSSPSEAVSEVPGKARSETAEESFSAVPEESASEITGDAGAAIPDGEELFCLADTEEEAEKIAGQYGISLVRFANGVATFHTEETDLSALIDKGKKNGWPLLEVNHIITAD